MPQIKIVPVENIIAINELLSSNPCDSTRAQKVECCFSSFYYYNTLQEQIASIVLSLLKGHFFLDANKRTSLFVYIVLSELNKLDYVKDVEKQVKIFVDAAACHNDVWEFARQLYP